MKPVLSIIICTYNPRRDYLDRVLRALQEQTLPLPQWELLLIDNASDRAIALEIALDWHPHARHIREEQLGLTPARLRGIQEAQSETLVFVDDDNVLAPDYLEVALRISQDYPCIGAWGGRILPEFEETPPEWTKNYWWMLALRDFERDQWSNLPEQWNTIPCGAGICVRKKVANHYAESTRNNVKRFNLDRKGAALTSGGDMDLALTSHELHLGTGEFVDLKLTHLMPKERLQEEYLLRLFEANAYSSTILQSIQGKAVDLPKYSWKQKILNSYSLSKMEERDRKFHLAYEKGKLAACAELNLLTHSA